MGIKKMEAEKTEKSVGKVLECETCGNCGPSVVRPSLTVLGAVWLFSFLSWCCCCLAALPFFCSCFRKVLHRCPSCGKVIQVDRPELSTAAKAGLICALIPSSIVSVLIVI